MMQRLFLSLLAGFALTQACYADESAVYATEKGKWVTIYMNDFVGMHYAGGITKNAACVSEAKQKAHEFQERGLFVSTRLLMNEMAAFEVKGRDSFLIFCNANGALLVNMLVNGASADAMAKVEAIGTQGRIGDAPPTVSKTVIDVSTGKAVNTTVIPND